MKAAPPLFVSPPVRAHSVVDAPVTSGCFLLTIPSFNSFKLFFHPHSLISTFIPICSTVLGFFAIPMSFHYAHMADNETQSLRGRGLLLSLIPEYRGTSTVELSSSCYWIDGDRRHGLRDRIRLFC